VLAGRSLLSREAAGFGLAGVAILLRIASDWLFRTGGPLPYQLMQALFLLAAVMVLGRCETIFLTKGQKGSAVREALMAPPFALLGGLALAWMRFGGPQWPGTAAGAAAIVGNNLFFPAVEELEFRGFLLAWLLQRGMAPRNAVLTAAMIHVLAHLHWWRERNLMMLALSFFLFLWYGSLTVRTRSLWGAIVAHASVNIFGFLPTTGRGARTP
jgi:membrane protease YdiL (CAAX protease family)